MQAVAINISIGERLAQEIDRNGLSQRELARQIGSSKNTVSLTVKGETLPRTDFWLGLHKVMPSTDLHYLITGERRGSGFGESLSMVREEGPRYGEPTKPKLRVWVANAGDTIEQDVLTDFFDIDLVEDYPTVPMGRYQPFLIQGDSMAPDIAAGDILFGEAVTREEDFAEGAVYMVLVTGQLLCKRVYRDEGDRQLLLLASMNPQYRDRRVEASACRLWRAVSTFSNKNLGGI